MEKNTAIAFCLFLLCYCLIRLPRIRAKTQKAIILQPMAYPILDGCFSVFLGLT